ncbi:DUF4251 domain-containing protein [Flavobacterium rhamnosiphilum]|uniref:DUF4251 domain-containing protein n=1 Tax=Flavobacterium rhamnosiphilum TaxID=2541724 RepID=A0A4R5F2V8_9FLAO|nr:DUF4251 domain-containing protein [Flavobacterium rhamnosiphilum]TDE41915.1 DUF4251 domain-containing protein [Flavobacterium rhamnosiphilum]
MKIKTSISVIFLSLLMTTGYAQEKSKKELKEERKIEKQKQTAALVDSKEFVFIGKTAFPQGFRTMDLTTNSNYIKFQPDFIKSEMPFFGRAYSGVGYGGGGGLNFEGKPQEFTIEKGKKAYQIKAVVRGDKDTYRLLLSVFFEGSATLSISSNNRSTISYNGEITPIEKKEAK